VDVKFVTQ